ncbi:hypothetical protein FHL15_009906 [Xylaria flabelliformis]|uniref:Uncharacterized protein n=1 Tax=Xylaria flabelliformis TaxID=2512241 RepID=A0A553HMM6_9PEZI|nr:hypothetical protein FHL15_009906 [Xylaria flabelliformis]
MFSSNFLAIVLFLVVTPILAGRTPQGYGYGDVTETVFGASTGSPEYTDNTPYPPVVPLTITDSVTLTKPVTVEVTVTHTVTPECSSEIEFTTTSSGTTSTTLTTKITVFVPGGSSFETPTSQPTAATTPGFSGADVSTITIGTPAASATTGFVASDTTTSSCASITTSDEVDGVTDSLSGTPISASTLSIPGPNTETSGVGSGASTGIVATHTFPSPMVPLPTIVISTGVQWMVDARLLAVLPFWVLALTI